MGGDGQLHYYLYNYRTAPIAGGVDAKNNADSSRRGGIGTVMVSVRTGYTDRVLTGASFEFASLAS